jgi:glutamine cyclotransferase
MIRSRAVRVLAAALTLALLTACSAGDVARWAPEVVATHPHDPTAFTQGLVFHADRFY